MHIGQASAGIAYAVLHIALHERHTFMVKNMTPANMTEIKEDPQSGL